MAVANAAPVQRLALLKDDHGSLKKIIQRRLQERPSRPLGVYFSSDGGPEYRQHFQSIVKAWVAENSFFELSGLEHADVIVIDGTFSDGDKAQAFKEVTDHRAFDEQSVGDVAKRAVFRLIQLLANERAQRKVVHFWTYQR